MTPLPNFAFQDQNKRMHKVCCFGLEMHAMDRMLQEYCIFHEIERGDVISKSPEIFSRFFRLPGWLQSHPKRSDKSVLIELYEDFFFRSQKRYKEFFLFQKFGPFACMNFWVMENQKVLNFQPYFKEQINGYFFSLKKRDKKTLYQIWLYLKDICETFQEFVDLIKPIERGHILVSNNEHLFVFDPFSVPHKPLVSLVSALPRNPCFEKFLIFFST
jgi:hypothetical protein